MNVDILKKLKNVGLLSDQRMDLGNVPTGNFALNKIISGNYKNGVPIGMITQFYGESSTAKTVFVTHILSNAQKLGYYTALIDSENAFNPIFAASLGLDPEKLLYATPDTVEGCFEKIEAIIKEIRGLDKDTPIIIGYDSIAVSPSKVEFEAEGYESSNMIGAIRAKAIGNCLRKINSLMRKYRVCLLVVNQIRNKVGVMFGSPETMAAGGKSLEYYLGVNLKTVSNKTSDLIRDDNKKVIGISGRVDNKKNKFALPFRSCNFRLIFDKGLAPEEGLVELLGEDGVLYQPSQGWWGITGTENKFRKKDFFGLVNTSTGKEWDSIRELLGL